MKENHKQIAGRLKRAQAESGTAEDVASEGRKRQFGENTFCRL